MAQNLAFLHSTKKGWIHTSKWVWNWPIICMINEFPYVRFAKEQNRH